MRNRGFATTLVAVLLLTPCTAAGADEVVVGVEGTASTHAPGRPTTAEPWQSMTSASFSGDGIRREWTGTATLGAPLPAGHGIVIGWGLGRQQPGGCEVMIQFAESSPPVAADGSITVTRPYSAAAGNELSEQFTCLDVVLSVDGTPTDVLSGVLGPRARTSGVEARPAGRRFTVAAGRTTPAIVLLTSHVAATTGAMVYGGTRRVDVAGTPTGAVAADRARAVVVEVTADRAGTSRQPLFARDERDSSALDREWPVVARAIEAQRPLPGRYVSTDGSVRFRVTRDFRVRQISAHGIRCAESGLDYALRQATKLRIPRDGAAARVVRTPDPLFGAGFTGVQLLTMSEQRIVGTVAVATYSCTGSLRFAAKRQG